MIEEEQPTYEHESTCAPIILLTTANPEIKTCLDCAGLFDAATGKGLLIMDRRIV